MARAGSFDPIAARYDETRGGARRAEGLAGLVHPHLVHGPVLEVGVGTAIIAEALAARGHRVLGCDLARDMLRLARRRLGPVVSQADAERLPVATGSVGGVVMVWSLHLVVDPLAALHEAARALRAGGVLVVVPVPRVAEGSGPVRAAQRPMTSLHPDRPDLDQIDGWCRQVGLTPVARDEVRLTTSESPAEAAAQLDERVWSSLWDIDDERWQSVVVPVIEALRALPEPDTPIDVHTPHRVTVARRA